MSALSLRMSARNFSNAGLTSLFEDTLVPPGPIRTCGRPRGTQRAVAGSAEGSDWFAVGFSAQEPAAAAADPPKLIRSVGAGCENTLPEMISNAQTTAAREKNDRLKFLLSLAIQRPKSYHAIKTSRRSFLSGAAVDCAFD